MASLTSVRTIPLTAPSSAMAALRACPTFKDLATADVERLARVSIERTYRTRQALVRRDDTSHGIFVVMDGIVKLAVQSRDGDEAILHLLGRGDVFGEASLVGQSAGTDAEAVVDTRVLQIPQVDVVRLMTNTPHLALQLLANAVRREQSLADQMTAISFMEVEGRLAGLLLRLVNRFGDWSATSAKLHIRLTHTELAGMIGASRESVNKALRQFSTRGWISYQGQRLEIIDPAGLRERVSEDSW